MKRFNVETLWMVRCGKRQAGAWIASVSQLPSAQHTWAQPLRRRESCPVARGSNAAQRFQALANSNPHASQSDVRVI